MEKKNVIFLSVIAIATLLTAVVGTTFAYFTATVTGNDSATTTTITTATLGATYSDGDQITATNVVPGYTENKTISIENTSAVDMKYSIKWTSVSNNFATKSDLVYTLTPTDSEDNAAARTIAETTAPSADGSLLSAVTIAAGTTHSYTLTITFKETNVDQNANQGKTFSAKFQAEGTAIA